MNWNRCIKRVCQCDKDNRKGPMGLDYRERQENLLNLCSTTVGFANHAELKEASKGG